MAYRLVIIASLFSFADGLARAPTKNLAQIFKETVASHEDGAFAATPITKRRVAVVGAGGKAGSMVFGAVQRAAQTFDAGLAAPRALCGAARGSRALNSVLGSSFVLAFAGEDLVKLTDFRDDAKLEKSLEGCATVVAPARLRPAGAVTGTEWTWDLDVDVDESVADGDDAVFGRVARVAAKLGAHVIAVASPASAAGGTKLRAKDALVSSTGSGARRSAAESSATPAATRASCACGGAGGSATSSADRESTAASAARWTSPGPTLSARSGAPTMTAAAASQQASARRPRAQTARVAASSLARHRPLLRP